jgi:hypothetical protein
MYHEMGQLLICRVTGHQVQFARRTYPVCRLNDESVPGPLRDVQTVWHILCRAVVARHRGRGSPREVIVQHASKPLVTGEADIFQRLIETRDGPLVHLLVQPIAAVNPHDRGLIAVLLRVRRWPAERLGPVRGKALGMLWVVPVAECMANHFVL